MELTDLHDADGKPVGPYDRPPDVTDLPMYPEVIAGTPKGVELRYLGGNWYGDGPCVVFWHPKRNRHAILPVSKLLHFREAARAFTLSSASKTSSGYWNGRP